MHIGRIPAAVSHEGDFMKKRIAIAALVFGVTGRWRHRTGRRATPNGTCHDTTGNAAGKANSSNADGSWQHSLEGQQRADDANDTTQADSQC